MAKCFTIFKSSKCGLKKLILVQIVALKSTKKVVREVRLMEALKELIWSKTENKFIW